MSKKLKESSQMSPFAEYVEKNLHSPSYAGKSDANKSPLSSPRSVSSYSFTTNVAPVMDAQIARLINKVDNVDASHIMGKQVEAHDELEAPAKQYYTERDKYTKELQISSDGLIPVDELKESIKGTIRSKIEGTSKSSLTYSKHYTPRIDNLMMSKGNQQFDGKGKPKQHVAHFIETCNNVGTYGASQKQEETKSKERAKPFSKAPSKESMTVNVTLFKLKSIGKDNVAQRNNVPYERPQRKLTLKEMQATEYPFLDSDVPGIFNDLLEANLIDLPEMKTRLCNWLARVITLEDDSIATNVITTESGYVDGNNDSCNAIHGDNITSNEDTLFGKHDSSDADDCVSTITFTDEDLLLGSKPHNRHLFVAGYVCEQKVNRILNDGGSAVNILPLRILRELGIPIDELFNSRLMIQSFNQGGQRVVGIIRMQLIMEDMVSSALFHIIDAKTSYNMLLVKKVPGDDKPFTEAESHFADAKYYIQDTKKEKNNHLSHHSKDLYPQPRREGGHKALVIDEKGFDKAFKLLIKAGYDHKKKLSLGKHPPEATAKAQIVIFTQVQSDDEDDKESLASSNYISNGAEEDIAQTYHITLIDDSEVEKEDAEDAPAKLEEGIKATIDELKEVNLGDDIENPRPIYISASLTQKMKELILHYSMNLKMYLHGPTRKCPD
ncbi:hypothetical protein Sango_1592600 [Sesamum angolense]|uniref:Uncharacterized protein n=1 Tax=Sesamum angolense TaxID=2727404 RepID=A0AAE1WQB5_9LAMI|nr:hypothetical protein Sango_1592600 [Sesamum angolense]